MKIDSVIIKVENGRLALHLPCGMDGEQLQSWLEKNRQQLNQIKKMMSSKEHQTNDSSSEVA